MNTKIFDPRVITFCTLSLLLAVVPTAIAEYRPPRTQKTPTDYSKSGGVRGCPEDKIPLTILAPQKYVGETTSVHPTFAWFVSKSYDVSFRLFEFDQNGEPKDLIKPVSIQKSSGISNYSLPENQPALIIGKKYLWQVSIRCPQGDLIQAAEFTVKQTLSTLSNQFLTRKDGLQKLDLYAEASLWYNALEEALKLTENQKEKAVSNLLRDLALSEQPQPDAKQNLTDANSQEIQKHINNLKQIASNHP
ncbi:MAG: DUF928 domain-containing protein [Rhizonema sp. PD38]|nr:DUF928 domain-containing protein [Rhizonema sp. PD38]